MIFHISVDNPTIFQTPLCVMEHAIPKRYRLVDCEQLVKNNTLNIIEFTNFPHVPYATISYVWKGNDVPLGYNAKEFSVVGAEEADPIGVEVLRDACVAALAKHARYLWIDRLCIMQTNKDDKRWQIREMYNIYHSCIVCIVLPGGLRWLVPIDEETNWIHRGWTLQEALAPPSIFVLFAWKFGQCNVRTGDQFWDNTIEEVIPNKSAMTSLTLLLDACTSGFISFKYRDQPVIVNTRLFGTFASPNMTVLSVLMSKDSPVYTKQYAVWKSALMRTSSRPVDMVFSIMGLFGVILDPGAFTPNDRIGATVALARQVLQQGGRASWLGVCLLGQPCPYLSTFPTFPQTHVSGKAFVCLPDRSYHEVSEFMDNEYPYLLAPARFVAPGGGYDQGLEDELMETGDPISLSHVLPKGSLSDNGYLTLSAKAIRVQPAPMDDFSQLVGDYDDDERPTLLKDMAGDVWKVSKGEEGPGPVTFAVMLSLFVSYIAATVPAKMSLKAMLIEEHAPDKFHLRSYLSMDFESKYWVESEWTECQFCVGGPKIWNGGTDAEDEEHGELAYTCLVEQDTPQLQENATLLKFKDATQKRRAESLPQWVAEQQFISKSS
ncbi:hypothetical protein VKT23_006031 [Stygiomarasmius scandens]|uniref:Heterokaryon incompatibility domain-containing protein n=1 Tax=Marasmiellus scandens TaxID=2682957 RepID=A0ABR1JRM8_9AGAR